MGGGSQMEVKGKLRGVNFSLHLSMGGPKDWWQVARCASVFLVRHLIIPAPTSCPIITLGAGLEIRIWKGCRHSDLLYAIRALLEGGGEWRGRQAEVPAEKESSIRNLAKLGTRGVWAKASWAYSKQVTCGIVCGAFSRLVVDVGRASSLLAHYLGDSRKQDE